MISIHAPRVGRDPVIIVGSQNTFQFQSTRPVWGATFGMPVAAISSSFQSTRPVWGATLRGCHTHRAELYFNPRAPCGARRHLAQGRSETFTFQSTRPVWGATAKPTQIQGGSPYFNPRAPCGARRKLTLKSGQTVIFQSTRPVWGATFPLAAECLAGMISIHAPRVGRDEITRTLSPTAKISIHAPRVGRDPHGRDHGAGGGISIHAPRVGRDYL